MVKSRVALITSPRFSWVRRVLTKVNMTDVEKTFSDAFEFIDEMDSIVISGITKDGRPFVYSNSSTMQEKCTVIQFLNWWVFRWFSEEKDDRESTVY